MVDVRLDLDTLRALDKIKHKLSVYRSPIQGVVYVKVGTSETIESYLRYELGTYGAPILDDETREHVMWLVEQRLDEQRKLVAEWRQQR